MFVWLTIFVAFHSFEAVIVTGGIKECFECKEDVVVARKVKRTDTVEVSKNSFRF